ncbi:MAG TPA: hypothetical protein PLU43_07480, partial [Lachnospiraceae bacterium]|nr:hypothetical protein [Lachnospiraceae bacterium]
MSNKNDEPDEKKKSKRKSHATMKRQKDQVSVTLAGMAIYSVVLIAIVAGTYLGIKAIFSGYQKNTAVTETTETADQTETPEEETVSGSESEVLTEPASDAETDDDETMQEELIDISSLVSGDNHYIDYSQTLFTPAERDTSLTWDDSVFLKLENVKNPSESLVNTYQFSRKFATREDDKKMEFDVYTNPDTKEIEKITAIEYCGDDTEAIDYYFDHGKINYAAQRRSVINTPVDISSAAVQSRYYFNQ